MLSAVHDRDGTALSSLEAGLSQRCTVSPAFINHFERTSKGNEMLMLL